MDVSTNLQMMTAGLAMGSIYALVALGFVLIFNAVGVVNFAQGEFVMVPAFVAVWLIDVLKIPFPLTYLITVIFMGIFGIVFQRIAYYPLRHRTFLPVIIATIGVSIFLKNGAQMVFGAEPFLMQRPTPPDVLNLGGVFVAPQYIVIIVATLAPVTGRKPHLITAHGMARTFQNIRLFGELTVLDNVLIGQHSRSRAGLVRSILQPASQQAEEAAMRQKALEALAFVGLRGKEFAEAKSLPYGQQRLLELARALVSDPKLLLLDEPAAGLNSAETEMLLDLLFQIRNRGITILLVEHDMSLVMNVSDHITVLNFGKKIAEGPAETIEQNQEVIDAYLGTEVGNA